MELIKKNWKLILILSLEFIALAICLILIFFAGKKTYTVTFDINEGTLIGGETVQVVTQGQSATPPQVAKTGHYLRGWSGSYSKVTSNVTVTAIWEYETTPGIEYDLGKNQTYCEISGCYSELRGLIYLGAYYNDLKILGVQESAFMGRSKITEVYMLDGILKIENSAFMDCTSLTKIELPSTVTILGNNVFRGCKNLTAIELPEALEIIGNSAFMGCTALQDVMFGELLTTVSPSTFENCSSLVTVVLPAGVKQIGASAFAGCSSLETVILSESLTAIPTSAFENCISLEEIAIPDGVELIDSAAFAGCTSLEKVVIPATVKEIKSGAFTTSGITLCFTASEEDMAEILDGVELPDDAILIYNYSPNESADENPSADVEEGASDL